MGSSETQTLPIEGPRVGLRLLERQDLPLRVKWVNDPEVRGTLMFDYPLSLARTEQWFGETIRDDSKRHFSIVHREDGRVIGMTGLLQISRQHRKGQLYITIGEKDYWGQRLADEVIDLLLGYAFLELGLNKVFLYTVPANERGRRVYERNGFREDGVLRQEYWCLGALQDLHVHSILRSEWEDRKRGIAP